MSSVRWKDPLTGMTFNLPYFPSSREELDELLASARIAAGAKVEAPIPQALSEGVGLLEKGYDKAWEGVKGGANWLMNAPFLKPVADALRDPSKREWARENVPGLEAMEAIPGAISGYAGLVGAGIDRPINEVAERGDLLPIVKREYEEGLPALMEQAAPIDVITAGLGGAASLARGTRAFTPLARAAQAADVAEGAFGGSQIVGGVREGNIPEIGIGAVRLAGGLGGLVGGPKPEPDVIPDVEDFIEAPLTPERSVELPVEELDASRAALRPPVDEAARFENNQRKYAATTRLVRLVSQADQEVRRIMPNIIGSEPLSYAGNELLFNAYGRSTSGGNSWTSGSWVNDLEALAEDASSLEDFATRVADNMVHEQGYHSADKLHGMQNIARDAEGNPYYINSDGTKVIVPEEAANATNYAARSQYGEPEEFGAHTQGTAVANNPDIIAVKERLRDAIINSPELWDSLKGQRVEVGKPFPFSDERGARRPTNRWGTARGTQPTPEDLANIDKGFSAIEQTGDPQQKLRMLDDFMAEYADKVRYDPTLRARADALENGISDADKALYTQKVAEEFFGRHKKQFGHDAFTDPSRDMARPPRRNFAKWAKDAGYTQNERGGWIDSDGNLTTELDVKRHYKEDMIDEAWAKEGDVGPLGEEPPLRLPPSLQQRADNIADRWRQGIITDDLESHLASFLREQGVDWDSADSMAKTLGERYRGVKQAEGNVEPLGGVQSSSAEGGQANPPSEGEFPVQAGVHGVQRAVQAGEGAGEPGGAAPLSETPGEPKHVTLAQEDQNYTYHSTDRVENLEGILKEGLKTGHASNVKGQGTSGPYVVVYEGRQSGLTPVEHRPGDFMGKVKGKPKAVIVHPEEFVEKGPVDQLLKKVEDLEAKRDAYVKETYPDLPKRQITRRQWNEELGLKLENEYAPDQLVETIDYDAMTPEYREKYTNDRKLRDLDRRLDEAQSEYLDAADKGEGYKPRTYDDYFNEAKEIADKYGVPVIRAKTDAEGDLTIPEGSLKGQQPEVAAPVEKPTLEAKVEPLATSPTAAPAPTPKTENVTTFNFDKPVSEAIRKQFTDAGFTETINPDGSVTYTKGAKAKGQTFAQFLQEKFGDRTTTGKERAIARAEWNRKKEERKMLKLAGEANIPPDKLKALLESVPDEAGGGTLSGWRRAVYPVIENLEKVHPWFADKFRRYVADAETPAMKNIADSYRIKRTLSKPEQRLVIDILDGKKAIEATTPANVKSAVANYRAMLDQAWTDAIAAGVRRKKDRKRAMYFPHKFAEGWDDNLVQNLYLDKNWDLKQSNLEKARLSKRADYRRDLDVLDEYFLSAYRRIAEVRHFGKRLQTLRKFAKEQVTDKVTSEWMQTNIRRVLGREHPTSFDRVSGHLRHVQALTDLGLAAFYQPIQATNTALYGGLGRSMRALRVIAKNYPDEVYDAIRSRALVPDITQELISGAYGAREGIPSRALQKFMWGIPTVDRFTRIHANTVGKLIVEDALKGNKGALKDIKALGFSEIDTLAKLKAAADKDPDFALKVGRELSDRSLFRSGAMELPGWSSSTAGKLGTQYMRFMYRHSLFIRDIFKQAGEGNTRPLARFLTVAPALITGMAEVLYPIREALRETIRQTVGEDKYDPKKIKREAIGSEREWDEEIEWYHILRNKRIPWTHPVKRLLQNVSMWGGIGVFQIAAERIFGATGSPLEVGAKGLGGPLPSNIFEGFGSAIKDVGRLKEDVEERNVPFRNTRRWGVQQVPLVGYPAARRMKEELGE